MSLTPNPPLPVTAGDLGINTFLRALFKARPQHLHYGSVPFVSASSVSATHVDTAPFPGLPGGLPYAVSFSLPVIELPKPRPAAGAQPILAPGQLHLSTLARVTIGCFSWTAGAGGEQTARVVPVTIDLDVLAIVSLVAQTCDPCSVSAGLRVHSVWTPDAKPEGFAAVIDDALHRLLQSTLSHVQLPAHLLCAGS